MRIAAHIPTLLRFARHAPGGILLVGGIFFTWFWAVEVWLRQEWMFKVNENHLLAAGLLGLVGGFGFISISLRGSYGRKFICTLLASGLTFPAIFGLAHSASVRSLWEKARIGTMGNTDHDHWYAGIQDRWDKFIVEIFYEKSTHPWRGRYNYRNESKGHRLECSRWRARKAFIRCIATDEDKARSAFVSWDLFFPAVIGQDVTLARRQELLQAFSQLSRREDLPGPCRDAMLLWMGLIFLTDHEAFAEHRVAIRDAMLARESHDFPMDGDVWMRVLNCLLAFDPPESRAGLVSRYANIPEMLRRAVRESLRGIEQQADAVLAEIKRLDQLDRPSEAAALWLDLLDLHNQPNAQPMPQLAWTGLQQIMTNWLQENSPQVRARFSLPKEASQTHQVSGEDFKIALPEEAQARLVEHSEALIRKLATSDNGIPTEEQTLPVEIEHLLMLGQFLDDGRRKSVANALAPHLDEQFLGLVNHDLPGKLQTKGIDETSAAFLRIWEDLDESKRKQTRNTIRQIRGMDPGLREFQRVGSPRTRFFFEAWESCSGQPLSELERFLVRSSLQSRYPWQNQSRWWGRNRPISPAPPCSPEIAEKLVALLATHQDRTNQGEIRFSEGSEGFVFPRFRLASLWNWWYTLHKIETAWDL